MEGSHEITVRTPDYISVLKSGAKDGESKNVSKEASEQGQGEVLKGCDKVRNSLGSWQYNRFKDRQGQIRKLMHEINNIMDMHGNVNRANDCVVPVRN